MTLPVLLTKVALPGRREEILTRERLIGLLDELLDNKLVFVSAPAGYGKTSLLIDFAYHHEFPCCWYSLDVLDRDPQRFFAYFVASIERRFPRFGQQSKSALESMSRGDISLELIETSIVNEIYLTIREHFFIVIDDYHLVDDSQAINAFVNRFVQNVDQNCHLVILSRALISFPDLPLMVARSQVGGVGLQELAFRAGEIQALMAQNYRQSIPESVASELAQKTEGWITGLLLSAETMWQGMVDRLRLARASGMGLYAYLIHEVLDQQTPEKRWFLLQTSFLEEFDAELCQALLGEPPTSGTWQGMLDEIRQDNLFVLPVGEPPTWLRYHHLFRDFLQNQLAREQPEEVERIHRRLVDIYSGRQEWERAYAACQLLGGIEKTADLLEQAGSPMVKSGRMTLMGEWLGALPVEMLNRRPRLLARQGIVLATQGDTAYGLRLLDRAVAHFRTVQNRKPLAGTLVWRAFVHQMRASHALSLADAAEVLALTENVENDQELVLFRAEAYRIHGLNSRMLGKLDEAISHLSQAFSLYQALADEQGMMTVQLDLGVAYLDTGDFTAALSCLKQALAYRQAHHNLYGQASVLNNLALLYHLRGEYPLAFATYEQGLEAGRQGNNVPAQAFVLIGLGDLYIDLDAPQTAAEVYRQARDSVERLQNHFLMIYLDLAEAAVARLSGLLSQARRLLDSAGRLVAQEQSDYIRGLFLLESGRLALAEKDIQEAAAVLAEAAEIFERGGQRVEGGRAFFLLAAADFDKGDNQAALLHLEQAFQQVSGLDSAHILTCPARQARSLLAFASSSPQASRQALRLLDQVERFEAAIPKLKRQLRFQQTSAPVLPPSLRVQAFGAAQVYLDENAVTSAEWQTEAVRELFFLVLSEPRGRSKEAIGDILWPECSPARYKSRFKNSLYRLRRALQQDVIVFDGERYQFNRDLDYEYDVEQFSRLLAQAENAPDVAQRKEIYQALARLYCGEYLPPVIGAWVLPEREHLKAAFLNAQLQLARLYLDDRQYHLVLDVCQSLIAQEACLEEAYRLVMQVEAALGNRPAVVHQYESLKKALESELGAFPATQTEELYRSLVR